MGTPNSEGTPRPDRPMPDSQYLRIVISHYLHQDRLVWGQMSVLGLVQVATIGAGYSAPELPLALGILAMGFLITIALWKFVHLCLLDRDENVELMDKLWADFRERFGDGYPEFRVVSPRRWLIHRARSLLWVIIGLLLAADVVIAVWRLAEAGVV